MTEELDNSLRQTIESYLGDRLRAIDEQISRLQSEFNDALARLRESSANESLDETPVSAAIAAHLQAAREQKLTGHAAPLPAETAPQVAIIKRSVAEIGRQQTHADVLRALLTSAVQFADRVALFVIRNEQAIGWQECEAGDATNLESIRGVALPLNAETLLGQAALSRSAWSGEPGSNAGDQRLIEELGGEPKHLAAVPLIVRGKVVAVLYADTASTTSDAMNLDAIELLSSVAAMAINLASAPAAAPMKSEAATSPEPAQTTAALPTEATTYEPESGYQPHVEPAAPEAMEEAAPEPVSEEVVSEQAADTAVAESATSPAITDFQEPKAEEPVAEPEFASRHEQQVATELTPTLETAPVESAPPAPPPSTEAPAFAANYASPLGSARRFGVTEPELPIEVGEEERRLHNDARRFARLLVSEIKLYNEQKVKEGRNENNLYERLREDIDRSRQMYDKRVAPPVAARHDYFHQELVNTLAEGDTGKLGSGYPGASVVVTQ